MALWLPNGSGYLAAIFACARLGALAIHINTRFRMAEVGNLLRRSRAVALVTQWGFPPVNFPAIFAALPVEDRMLLWGAPPTDSTSVAGPSAWRVPSPRWATCS